MPAKKCSIVLIEWLDAWSNGLGYATPSNAENEPVLMQDVGFLLKRTKKGISFASCACALEKGVPADYRHTGFIPAGMIKKVTILRK